MEDLFTGLGLKVQGHLKIYEYASREDYLEQRSAHKLLDRRNAIHKDNASILVIKAITNQPNSNIRYMAFGNGGTTIDDTGTVSFKPTNDADANADLYNPVFFQMVDDRLGALAGNQMAVRHMGNTLFSDVDIRALININEPFGQQPSNTIKGITGPTEFGPFHTQFTFDEIGLKLADGTLLTHVIFTPILKTASSLLEVVYTLRVAIDPPIVGRINEQFGAHGAAAPAQVGSITVIGEVPTSLSCVMGIGVNDYVDLESTDFNPPASYYGLAYSWSRGMVSTDTYDSMGGGIQLNEYNYIDAYDDAGNIVFDVLLFDYYTERGANLCNTIVSWDTLTQTVQVMQDGVLLDLTGNVTWYSTNQIGYAVGHTFGINPYYNSFVSATYNELYMFWYDHLTSFFDLTITSNVEKIRSIDGQIFDPGNAGQLVTGTTPALFMYGDASQFPVNHGSVGTFSSLGDPLVDSQVDSCATVIVPFGLEFTEGPTSTESGGIL